MSAAGDQPTISPSDEAPPSSAPVDISPLVSASLEKLLGAGLSPNSRGSTSPTRLGRDQSSSREGLSSSNDDLSPAPDLMTNSAEFDRGNDTNRSSLFDDSWNPLEDQYEDRPARPSSCDALSAGSLPLTSSDSRSRDELLTGLDSTEDELDSGIMDDDLPVQLRRRQRSLSDRSSSRSLEDQLDLPNLESAPLNTDSMKHRIAVSRQRNTRKPTRLTRYSQPLTRTVIPECTRQTESLDAGLLRRQDTPPSPLLHPRSPKLRHTPPTTPGTPSPRATPPVARARLSDRSSSPTLSQGSPGSVGSPTRGFTVAPSSTISYEATVTHSPTVTHAESPSVVQGLALTPPRPRSVTEPAHKAPEGFMNELKKKAASKEDLTAVTPRKPVLPAISPKVQAIHGAVTTESSDAVSPEPKLQKPKFDTKSPKQSPERLNSDEKPKIESKSSEKPKPNLPPKSSASWFEKIRLRKKSSSVDVVDADQEAPVIVQPSPQNAAPPLEHGTPPWLRETRLRRSATKNGKEAEKSDAEKPSWMTEVLARRRKTQEKLNVGEFVELDKDRTSTPKKSVSPLKRSTENRNNADDESAKNSRNLAARIRTNQDLDSGTSSLEPSPMKRPSSLLKRDENSPPTSKGDVGPIAKVNPLPPISKTGQEGQSQDNNVPSWKAEIAIRKSQRKIAVPKAEETSSDVPQWKRELMEKKRQKNSQPEEDSSLAGLPPWKQELMRKKKEKGSGVTDGGSEHSQC